MFFTPPPLHSCTSPFYFLCVVWVEAFLRLLVPLKQGRGLFECCTNVIYIIPKESSLLTHFFCCFVFKSSCCCFLIVNPQKKRDSRSCGVVSCALLRFGGERKRERETFIPFPFSFALLGRPFHRFWSGARAGRERVSARPFDLNILIN